MLVSSYPAVIGDGVADDTAALQAVIDAAAGKVLFFDVAATYKIARILFRSNSTVIMGPNVSFTKKLHANGTFYWSDISSCILYANGAQIDGHDVPGSTVYAHTMYVLGTTNCEIHDLNIFGSSVEGTKDALYIGKGTGANQNLLVRGGSYTGAARNNISVVSAHDTRLEDLNASGALFNPGCGIDVEANVYGAVSNTQITRVTANWNNNAGILTSFGVGTVIDNCDAHSNGHYGFCSASGSGMIFAEGVYRPNIDIMAVSAVNTTTGVLTVSAQPPIGTPLYVEEHAGTRPPELPGGCLIVSRHVSTTGVILGRSVDHNEFLSFSSAGTGTLTNDPATSALRLLCLVDGQSNGGIIKNSRATGNDEHALAVVNCGGFLADNNDFGSSGTANVAIANAYNVTINNTRISGGSRQGIAAVIGGGYLNITDCTFTDTLGRGVSVSEWSDSAIDGNTFDNCGSAEPSSAKASLHYVECVRPTANDNRVMQDAGNTTTLFGIYAEGSVSGGTFTNNDLTGAGTTNGNAMIVPAGSVKSGNIGRDGLPIA